MLASFWPSRLPTTPPEALDAHSRQPKSPPRFQVVGRVGIHRGAAQFVDTTTGYLQKPLTQSALGPVERAYNPAIPHQDLRGPGRVLIQAGQDTMRAHHIADSQIQQMVCDYMNGQITLLTLLDRLGVLYLTSWIDVVVTPRLFYIWRQWAHSLVSTFGIALASFRGLVPNQQARLATNLAAALSSSISNLRVGDQQTDAALGQAIAPRLRRGAVGLGRLFRRLALTLQFRPADAFCGDLPGCRRLGQSLCPASPRPRSAPTAREQRLRGKTGQRPNLDL